MMVDCMDHTAPVILHGIIYRPSSEVTCYYHGHSGVSLREKAMGTFVESEALFFNSQQCEFIVNECF